jgi:hypothetical protein
MDELARRYHDNDKQVLREIEALSRVLGKFKDPGMIDY